MAELLETLQTKVELVKRNVGTCVFTVELILLQFQFSMKYHEVNFLKLKQNKKKPTDIVRIGANLSHSFNPCVLCWKRRPDGTFHVV